MIRKLSVFFLVVGLSCGAYSAQSIHDLITFAEQTVASNSVVSVTNDLPQIGVVKGYGVYASGGSISSSVFTVKGDNVSNTIDATPRSTTAGTPYKASVASVPLLNELIKFTFFSEVLATSTVTVTPYVIIEK